METTITPHAAGFGQYQSWEFNGNKWKNLDDLITEISQNVDKLYVLGEDELPPGIKDIRGSIYNEPEIVIAYREDGKVYYEGITEYEELEKEA